MKRGAEENKICIRFTALSKIAIQILFIFTYESFDVVDIVVTWWW